MRPLVILLLLLPGCLGTDGPAPGGDVGTALEHHVQVQDFAFQPPDINISAGQAVVWTNHDEVDHHIVSEDGSIDSGRLPPGARFAWTFEEPGHQPYRCLIHASMVGSVQVS